MRRIAVLLLCIVLLVSLAACKMKEANIQEPTNFYYCRKEISYHSIDGVILGEIREAANFHGDSETMLLSYLLGPYSNDYISLIPTDTKLISFQTSGEDAYLILSEEFAQLSGIKLITACSCIAMTLYEYTGVETLHISVESGQLDGKDALVINALDVVLMDTLYVKG